MDLKAFARSKGKTLRQIGLAGAYASALNRGIYRAGAEAIASIAAATGAQTETVSAICDQCWADGQSRRAASPAPATSLPVACPEPTAGGVR